MHEMRYDFLFISFLVFVDLVANEDYEIFWCGSYFFLLIDILSELFDVGFQK